MITIITIIIITITITTADHLDDHLLGDPLGVLFPQSSLRDVAGEISQWSVPCRDDLVQDLYLIITLKNHNHNKIVLLRVRSPSAL